MNRTYHWILRVLIPLVGILSGCQAGAPSVGDGPPGVTFDVGENTLGEPCRVIGVDPVRETPELQAVYSVFCGRWEAPSARIYLAATTVKASDLIGGGWWRTQLDDFTNCGSPSPTEVLEGVPAVALDCGLRIGGWPYQALVVDLADRTYAAESIPAAYPATERALGIIAGRLTAAQAKESGTVSREIRRLEGRLAAARYNINDLNTYRDLLRLGQYYNFQGSHPEAEETYREVLHLHEEKLPGQQDGLSFLYMHIALELSNQGRFDPADALFEKAQALLPFSLEPTDAPTLVSYRALHAANQRQDERALELARQATAMRRKLARDYGYDSLASGAMAPRVAPSTAEASRLDRGVEIVTGRAATALGDVVQSEYIEAFMLVEFGNLDAAERALSRALQILAQELRVPRRWVPQVRMLQARIAESNGDYRRAERLLVNAIAIQQKLFSESRTEGLAYVSLGGVYAAQARSAEALEAFRTGFRLLGNQEGGLGLDEVLPFFRVGLGEAERAPEKRAALLAEMFEIGQLVRGPVAAQSMALTAARLAAGDQAVSGLIRELQDARFRRDTLREELTLVQADPRSLGPQIEEMEQKWQALNSEIVELERGVQAAAPRYNQLLDTPVSTAEVLDVLRPGEAIVQILTGTKGSFGFFVDSGGVEAYEIPLTDERIGEIVSELRQPFDTQEARVPPYAFEEAHALYEELFGPVTQRVGATRHLVNVPSGALLSLPFGLLVATAPPEELSGGYSQLDWVAARHALSLAPSVQSFVNLRTTVQPSRATRPLVGFGDFVPTGNPDAVLSALQLPPACLPEAQRIANLSRLPETAEELREVASAVGASAGDLHFGRAFSYENLREAPLTDYRIVYFATHGLLPHKLQCLAEPALALSASSTDSAATDGLLTTSEVVNLELDADLVVLSACDTGGPAGETGGESLSGLARSFFYAGARSVLVSHWEIPSGPTVDLLTRTFDELADQTLSLSEALRSSQDALIRNPSTSHPFAWGAFTVVGDGGQRIGR